MDALAEDSTAQRYPEGEETLNEEEKIDPFTILESKDKSKGSFLRELRIRLKFLRTSDQIDEYATEFDDLVSSTLLRDIRDGKEIELSRDQRSSLATRLGITPESYLKFEHQLSQEEIPKLRKEMREACAGNFYGTGGTGTANGGGALSIQDIEAYVILRGLDKL